MVHDTPDPSNSEPFKWWTVIASGSPILVARANGYVVSYVVDQLLQLVYNVRGTVRAEKPWLELYSKKNYEWFVNVMDTARLYIIATLDMEVEYERLSACVPLMNWAQVMAILQNLRPSNALIPTAPTEEPKD
ncbi:hypothetical protein N7519_004881 [Penicillium mononematosum]|uniref:uncharacterized protein n=1 Tax=Penicillium mononematosum TaxID=268346 RepID=UPI002548333D|nr:uncharacterized protein N7519_004881 [Penicillium mononematosum]KAJ6189973.1 hypothetical protein N7519_004881 [Penicillium mononematosum]